MTDVPKTFVFNVHTEELRGSACSILNSMEQFRNSLLAESAGYESCKNGKELQTEDYARHTYRLASILSELMPEHLPDIGELLDKHPMLKRYDTLNERALGAIAPDAVQNLKGELRGITSALGQTESTGYHVLQATLYLGKETYRPFQQGIKPQEIAEKEKIELVGALFGKTARLINHPADAALDEIAKFEDMTYNPAYTGSSFFDKSFLASLMGVDAAEIFLAHAQRLDDELTDPFGAGGYNFSGDLCDAQFVFAKQDLVDMIRLQRRDPEDGEYLDPDENWDSDDKESSRAEGSEERKDIFLVKIENEGYFLAMHEHDFSQNTLYLNSFAPDILSMIEKRALKARSDFEYAMNKAGQKTPSPALPNMREEFDANIIGKFCELARALGYTAAATHWLPRGIEYKVLLESGFRQVGIEKNFEDFKTGQGACSDAVILWKKLYGDN